MKQRPFVVRVLVGLLALLAPALAHAQAPRLPAFRPDVSFGIVFDDNVFFRPEPDAQSDIFMRLTPGFDLVHDSTRLTVRGSMRFDAERYQERPELNDVVARQNTEFDLTWRPNSRFSLTGRAGYQRTQTPIDINVATGLTGGRQEASRVDAGLSFEQTIRPRKRLSIGARWAKDNVLGAAAFGADSNLRSARVRYLEQLSGRTDLYFIYRFEQRQFLPGPLVASHIGSVGWSRQVSRSLRLVVEGGPRLTGDEWSPDVTVTATQTVNDLTMFTAGYAHTQDVAVGVVGLITIDRVTASMMMARARRWELSFGGGAFRNIQAGTDLLAYDGMASVGRSLGSDLWLVMSYNHTFNDQRVRGAAVPNTTIVRSVAMLSLRYTPYRPR
jgi:hypothetical protein